MDQKKRNRLEMAGWKIGSAKDFLDLTDEEQRLIDLRIALIRTVRVARLNATMTQEELAAAIGSSQSRIAKLEAGEPNVSIELIMKALLALGLSNQEIGRSIAAA
jgi:DNA-binding XRE family transcriptional regulator